MRSIPISASAKQWMTSQVQYISIHLFFFGSSGKKTKQVDFVPLLVNLLSTKGQYFSEHISQLQYIQIYLYQAQEFSIFGSSGKKRTMVFCYQNCSDLLWEKIVLVIEKNFWNSRLKAENLQIFWDHLNNLFKQWKVRTSSGNRMLF